MDALLSLMGSDQSVIEGDDDVNNGGFAAVHGLDGINSEDLPLIELMEC